jgi:threonine-phosphate decarboxylase
MALITHGGDIFAISRERGWDWREVLDFSASINPLGPSPLVEPAICAALERIVHYPEREPAMLRGALAGIWNIDEEQIMLGNGATELIFFLARILRQERVTLALPVFSEFHRAFPKAETADLMNTETWPEDGLLVLTRPANPTGWTLPLETLRVYLEHSRATVLVDESFLEFAGFASAAGYPRTIVLRSLTKFYALPGLRIGALVAEPDLIRAWNEEREPWQVNVLAEAAALAAIGDRDHAAQTIEYVRAERRWMTEQLASLPGVEPLPSDANFLCVRLGHSAASLAEYLLARRILIRKVSDQAVRIAIRPREQSERLLDAWKEFRT